MLDAGDEGEEVRGDGVRGIEFRWGVEEVERVGRGGGEFGGGGGGWGGVLGDGDPEGEG